MPRSWGIANQVSYPRNFPVLISLITALATILLSGCQSGATDKAGGPGGGAPQAMPVQVQLVASQEIADSSEYLAIMKSRHSSVINPQVEGQITKIFVKSGDHVKAGTPLLQIDPLKQQATVSSQEASRAAQEANMRFAQTQLERQKKLYEAGVTSKQDLDNAQTNHDAAVAQLKALSEQVNTQQAELRYYRISSPMTGIVGDIPVRVGDRVGVTTLLTTVDEPGALEAYIYVPADRGKSLKVGLPAKLLDEKGNLLSETKLSFVAQEVDPETQTVLAKAAIPNAKAELRVAQQLRAQLIWSKHDGPVIPVLAVSRINGRFFAFVAEKNGQGSVARQKNLKVGDTLGNNYAVLEGLAAGDHLIVSGTQFLQDGMPVAENIQDAGTQNKSAPGGTPGSGAGR